MVTALIRKKIYQFHLNKFIHSGKATALNREYIKLVESARREWLWANQLAAETTAADLIDQVLFYQAAAKQCYFYLLQKAGEDDLHADAEMVTYLTFSRRTGPGRQW